MRPGDWLSYDDVADTYVSVAVPHYFQPPADRLAAALAISSTDRTLDLGAGTGAVAAAALRYSPSVVAADVSCAMLLRSRSRGVKRCVVSALPTLSLADGSFDCVAAGFLLNHLLDLDAALREIARLLRLRGKLGVTSWARGPSDNEIGRAWSQTAEEFVSGPTIAAEVGRALPGEERLSGLQALGDVLSGGGLSILLLEQFEFAVSISAEDYAASRSASATARFLKSVLTPGKWRQFETAARENLIARFGPQLEFPVRVNLGIAGRR